MSAIKTMQKKCLALGGAYVHYSQSEEPTDTIISMMPYTEDGICKALAAKWIAEHANDRSLWTWLFQPGTAKVDPGKIANLMINFIDGTVQSASDIGSSVGNRKMRSKIAMRLANHTVRKANTGDLNYQTFVTDKYLQMFGVIRRGGVQTAYTGTMGARISHGYGPATANALAGALSEKKLNSRGGSYAAIGITGKAGGHAIAAFIGQDIAFFDPNYGEFWFPTAANFRAWFPNFWGISGYQGAFDTFYILPYGKKV